MHGCSMAATLTTCRTKHECPVCCRAQDMHHAAVRAARAHTHVLTQACCDPSCASCDVLQLFNNSAWAGEPTEERVVQSLDMSMPLSPTTPPFTIEVSGHLAFLSSYEGSCPICVHFFC
jgi:hypothetical protein